MATRRGERGLSLLETVIAIALLAMVFLALYGLIGVGIRGWVSLTGQTEVQQHPRIAAGRIVAEVRQSKDFVIGAGGTSLGLVKVTQLTGDTPAGATSFAVEDTSALAAGRPIILLSLNSHETVPVTGIAGTTVSVSQALSRVHRRGEMVRRGQTTLSAVALSGSTIVTVSDLTALANGDAVAIGGEGPFTVTIVGGVVSVAPALAQTHQPGEVVQPLSVVFQLTGAQLLRNGMVLADLLAAPPGRSFFAATLTTLRPPGAAIGERTLCVQSVAGFAGNDRIQVGHELYGADQAVLPDRATVAPGGIDASTNCLTVDRGLTAPRAEGAVVRVLAVEVNILGTQFNQAIGQTQEVAVTSRAVVRN